MKKLPADNRATLHFLSGDPRDSKEKRLLTERNGRKRENRTERLSLEKQLQEVADKEENGAESSSSSVI